MFFSTAIGIESYEDLTFRAQLKTLRQSVGGRQPQVDHCSSYLGNAAEKTVST